MNAEPAAPRRARFVVAYDGTDFHGFAEADGVPSVTGELRGALERICGAALQLVGAGRTDAGVHAWGQVVSCDLPAAVDIDRLAHRLSRMLGPSIVVREAAWAADPEFNARYSATFRQYRYDVVNTPAPVPMLARTAWHVHRPLDLRVMQLACDPLIGEHDFSSFCRRPRVESDQASASMNRRVLVARVNRTPSDFVDDDAHALLRFEVRANAFCHQMVRAIVGTLVDVGLGRLHAGEMRGILLGRDRAAAGQVAPPHGLTLWEVGYR